MAAAAATSLAAAAACRDAEAPPASDLAVTMASAYSAVPTGYSELSSSYVGEGGPFLPDIVLDDHHDDRGHHRGRGPGIHFFLRGKGPGFGLGFMGGGVFPGFLGAGIARAVFAGAEPGCEFDEASGLVTCKPKMRSGLTISRSIQFQDASGASQPHFGATTDAVTITVTVDGTTRRHGPGASDAQLESTNTVSGLGPGSTQITVNSTSAGTESATGKAFGDDFTAMRTVGDTVQDVVIPFPTGGLLIPYPISGTIIRSMSVTVTLDGAGPATSTRREVITYDGSTTATVEITLDGETQTCTLPLPFGRLTCP